jgi:hypothetical protein
VGVGVWVGGWVDDCVAADPVCARLLPTEDRSSKARWYKGLVKKYDRNSDRYLVRKRLARRIRTLVWCSVTQDLLPAQIVWETGGQDWVDELKDNEYKMAKAPAHHAAAPAPAPSGSSSRQQKRKRSVKEAKILVYGLPNSGKTSIINKLADQAGLGFSEDPAGPTHMFNVNRMHWNDVRLTVFDFGGKTEWRRSMWKNYFDQADALVRHRMSSCTPLAARASHWLIPFAARCRCG